MNYLSRVGLFFTIVLPISPISGVPVFAIIQINKWPITLLTDNKIPCSALVGQFPLRCNCSHRLQIHHSEAGGFFSLHCWCVSNYSDHSLMGNHYQMLKLNNQTWQNSKFCDNSGIVNHGLEGRHWLITLGLSEEYPRLAPSHRFCSWILYFTEIHMETRFPLSLSTCLVHTYLFGSQLLYS